jgi:transcription elongation factor GreA
VVEAPPCQAVFFMGGIGMANNHQPVYLTAEGLKKLQEEYEYLTDTRRKEVAQMIAEAKAEGDISENAGYDEAKTAQGFLEGRIRELEVILKSYKVIEDHDHPAEEVSLGRTVIVREDGVSIEETYTIVGSLEADPTQGRISNSSPIGKALLGKRVGARVTVNTPGGEIEFQILKIE